MLVVTSMWKRLPGSRVVDGWAIAEASYFVTRLSSPPSLRDTSPLGVEELFMSSKALLRVTVAQGM